MKTREYRNIYSEIVFWLLRHTNIRELGVHYVAAISMHETGLFRSAIFQENKNLFGMKVPRIRKHLTIAENRGHAVYRTYHDSLHDFILYLQHFRTNPNDFPTLAHFVRRLKSDNYFSDLYINYYRGSRSALPENLQNSEKNIVGSAIGAWTFARDYKPEGWKTPVTYN